MLRLFIVLFVFSTTIGMAQQREANFLQKVQQTNTSNGITFFKGISASVYPVTIASPLLIGSYGLIKKDSVQLRKSIVISSSILLAGAFTSTLKLAVNRNRPFVTYPNQVKQLTECGPHSFPSGHTTFAFGTATSLSLAYKKWYVAAPAFLWAGSVAYSRMYLGVHYPSDIAGGIVSGVCSALLCNYLNKKIFVR